MLVTMKDRLRPIYWRTRFSLLNTGYARERSLRRKLGERLSMAECSVCQSAEVHRIRFYNKGEIDKCYCRTCRHVFSRKLNRDLQRATELFAYDRPNEQYAGQRRLQLELINGAPRAQGRYLDLGVGGNRGIARELNAAYPQHEFWSCDLYPSDEAHYFQLYSATAGQYRFDGISSNAVVEHLDNTLEAWAYLNTLLKPMAEGGGLMVHAFPSQIIEDLDHWAIKIASHECLFSRESLALTGRKTGFELTAVRFIWSVQHPVYYFRKTFDWAPQ